MSDKEIMLIQNEDGTFSQYDDSNDIISCENEEQCEKVVELLKRHLKPVKPIILDTSNGDVVRKASNGGCRKQK